MFMMTNYKGNYQCSLVHDDAIPLLHEIPGKEMIKNIIRATELWRNWKEGPCPEVLFYLSHGEYSLGHCNGDKEISRIDSVISVRPAESIDNPISCILIGIEIKCSKQNLMNDTKLEERYLESGICDYYFLVASNDELALKAVSKYKDIYYIGVASLSSGRVFKIPGEKPTDADSRDRYVKMLTKRQKAPNVDNPVKVAPFIRREVGPRQRPGKSLIYKSYLAAFVQSTAGSTY